MVKLEDGIQSAESIVGAGRCRNHPARQPLRGRPGPAGEPRPALGDRAWRVRASFLPGRTRDVAACLDKLKLHEIDLRQGAVLETGCVYIAELQEGLALPPDLAASANPKSSTGRIDVFTRVITDQAREFDMVEAGYAGPLFAEISPRTFPVLVRTGSRLSQLRFRRGAVRLDDAALARLHAATPLVDSSDPSFQGGVAVSVDLSGFDGLIGYRAKRHTGLVDVDRPRSYPAAEFWEPLRADGSGTLILDPGQFYILASKEAVQVPPISPPRWCRSIPWWASSGPLRGLLRSRFRPCRGRRHRRPRGARGALPRRAVHAGGRPDRRPPRLRAHGPAPGRPLRQRRRLELQAQGLKLSKHFI